MAACVLHELVAAFVAVGPVVAAGVVVEPAAVAGVAAAGLVVVPDVADRAEPVGLVFADLSVLAEPAAELDAVDLAAPVAGLDAADLFALVEPAAVPVFVDLVAPAVLVAEPGVADLFALAEFAPLVVGPDPDRVVVAAEPVRLAVVGLVFVDLFACVGPAAAGVVGPAEFFGTAVAEPFALVAAVDAAGLVVLVVVAALAAHAEPDPGRAVVAVDFVANVAAGLVFY